MACKPGTDRVKLRSPVVVGLETKARVVARPTRLANPNMVVCGVVGVCGTRGETG